MGVGLGTYAVTAVAAALEAGQRLRLYKRPTVFVGTIVQQSAGLGEGTDGRPRVEPEDRVALW